MLFSSQHFAFLINTVIFTVSDRFVNEIKLFKIKGKLNFSKALYQAICSTAHYIIVCDTRCNCSRNIYFTQLYPQTTITSTQNGKG